MTRRFHDRREAGRELARLLLPYANRDDVQVLALPRGGVPVAWEIAEALRLPLDILVVRKLGLPWHPELAMGAIASGGARVLHQDTIDAMGVSDEAVERVAAREGRELARREHLYRGDRPPPVVTGRTVILVDDGLATGATMKSAIAALRTQDPARIVVAVPVAAPEACREIRALADEVVCALTPDPLHAVGLWYADFDATSDREVVELLDRAAA